MTVQTIERKNLIEVLLKNRAATPIRYGLVSSRCGHGDIYDLSDEEIDKWMKKAEKFILSLPWKKYIVLTVMTPDSLQGDDRNEDIQVE